MKTTNNITPICLLLFFGILLGFSIGCSNKKITRNNSARPEEKLGWHLGVQSYTFKRFTFVESLTKADSCGLDYLEAFPSQEIGGGVSGVMHFSMDARTRGRLKELLKASGKKILSYGVVKVTNSSEWRQVFVFCNDLGVRTITCEPKKEDLAIVSALCDEFGINAAIHNHPQPSLYWHPDSVALAVAGLSERLGACADLGHWVRSGLDPIDCLYKLNGRVLHFHFKDLNELNNRRAHDVIWGTGVCNIPEIIRWMKTENFKGMVSAEYEYNWDHSVPDVRASVNYFRSRLSKP